MEIVPNPFIDNSQVDPAQQPTRQPGPISATSTDLLAQKLQAIRDARESKTAEMRAFRDQLIADTPNRMAKDAAQAKSWVGQLGINPDGFVGEAVNTAASIVSGASRDLGGYLASQPHSATAGMADASVSQPELDAYNRFKAGQATPEDVQLLNTPKNVGSPGVTGFAAAKSGMSATSGQMSPMQLIEQANSARDVARKVNSFFDISSIVNQTNRDQFNADLGKNFQSSMDQITAGMDARKKGEYIDAAKKTVTGIAGLLSNAGEAALNNKTAVMEYAAENMPQLFVGVLGTTGRAAMAASNVGYAADYYQQGMENFQKAHQGQMPSEDQRNTMALWAASLAVAEHLGDHVAMSAVHAPGAANTVAKAITGVGEGASNMATEAAAKDAVKTGFLASMKRTALAGLEGATGEAVTEGYQGYAENKAAGKADATPFDIYQQAVIGGLSGHVLSAGGHAVSEITRSTPEQQTAQQQTVEQAKTFNEAAKANDPSTYLDPQHANYDPVAGIGVMYAHNQLDTTTHDVKQQNVDQAAGVVSGLLDQYDSLVEQAKTASPKEKAGLSRQMKDLQGKIDTSENLVDQMVAQVKPIQSTENVSQQVEQANQPVAKSDTTQAAPAVKAAEEIINLSMQNVENLTAQQADSLASNQDNALTQDQRDYLRTYSTARQSEQQLTNMSKVSQEIYYGNDKGNLGIAQYRQRVGNAIATNQREQADRAVGMLASFADIHASKAEAAAQAIKQGLGTKIVKSGNVWSVAPADMTKKQQRAYDDVKIINSGRLVNEMQIEAKALANAKVEAQAAISLHFSDKGVQSGSSAVQTPSATATPSPENKQGQAPNNSSQEAVKPSAHPEVNSGSVAEKTQPSTQEQQAEKVQPEVAANRSSSGLQANPTAASTVNREEEAKKPFQEQNLLVTQMTQRAGKDTGSLRPLVVVSDFLQALRESTNNAMEFLKDKVLTDQQDTALRAFAKTATDWSGRIDAMFKPKQKDFRFQDLAQFLVGEDGQLTANAKTAIAFGAYSWVSENISRVGLNTDKEINAILKEDKDASISDEAELLLRHAGTREALIINALGRPIVQAMGLGSLASASQDIMPRLVSHVGSYALKLLLDEGIITRETISGKDFHALLSERNRGDKQSQDQKFIKPGPNKEKVDEIIKAMKGTQGILNKVFGAESSLKEPGQEKIPFTQKTAGDGNQFVPSVLEKIMVHENAQANYARLDMYHLMTQLHPEVALAIAGFQSINNAVTHIANRDSIQAKNDGLQREYDRAMDYFGTMYDEHGLEKPMYFSHDVWIQQRVGIDTGKINPQTSKLHRHMVYRPSWEVEVRFTDTQTMDNFKLRVAEGLGVKTDKQGNEKSLRDAVAAINRPEIKAAVKVLRKALTEGGITREEQNVIQAGVEAGGENMHTLDALVAVAHYMEALDPTQPKDPNAPRIKPKNSFTTHLMGEVDGVTNGPMLSHLLLGAADSVGEMFALLNRGGFYEMNSGNKNYNRWRGTQDARDLYEITAEHMIADVRRLKIDQADMAAIYTFTGNLQAEDKAATKARRDIVKTPLTAMVFGSSVNNAIKSMADKFITSIYGKIEKAATADKEQQELDRVAIIRSLNQLGIQMGANTTIAQMMERQFKDREINMLRNSFAESLGKAVAETMKRDFRVYIEKRRTFNTSAQLAFNLYNAVYTGMRQQRIDELVKSGQIAVNPTTGQPIQDLSKKQEAQLRKELEGIMPLVHTAFSKESGQLNAGLLASKVENELSQNPIYASQINFANKFPDGPSSVRVNAMQTKENAPGVGTLVKLIHAFDSYPAHKSVMESEVLNVHDAAGAGLPNIHQAARNLNRNLWNGLLMYSPAGEMANTLSRVIQNIATMQEEGKLPESVQQALQQVLVNHANDMRTKPGAVLDVMLGAMKELARSSDDMKFQAMEITESVDQYALEGGNYDVTDADRRAAKKARMQVDYSMTAEDNRALAILSSLASGQVKAQAQTKEQIAENDQPVDLIVPDIPVASAMQILDGMGKDVQPAVEALHAGESLAEAMAKIKDDTRQARIGQLAEQYAALQAAQINPWGDLGAPSIESNQHLVEAFNATPVMEPKRAFQVLREALSMDKENRNTAFAMKLLNMLEKTTTGLKEVRMVTPATPASQVLAKGADKSRGWYVAKGDHSAVYLLSPDFKYSGLTPEVMLHELTHAALARTVQAELDAKATNPNHTSNAMELIDELERLRDLATKYVNDNKLTQFAPALANVHELISWGMSNLDFQRNVLNKVSMKSTSAGNPLVTGMKRFIEALTGLLFKGSDKSAMQQQESGMAVLIANASGLFHEAAKTKSKADLVLNQLHNGQAGPRIFSTTEIYDALGNINTGTHTSVTPGFSAQLRSLLQGIVDTLHGPFGTLREEQLQNMPTTPEEVFANALVSGKAPFASASLGAGFRISEQEAFVLEQVEATMRASMNSKEGTTMAAYVQLDKLYEEVHKKLKVEDFHPGDWSQATPTEKQEAQALYDFLFKLDQKADKTSDHLARFAALGLAHERVADLLRFATDVKTDNQLAGKSFTQKLLAIYDSVLSWLNGQYTHTFEGQQADAKLEQLVNDLVGIEAKKIMKLSQERNRTLEYLDDLAKTVATGARAKMEEFGRHPFFKNNTNAFIKAGGTAISAVAGDRVGLIMDGIAEIRNQHFQASNGLFMGIINEIRGSKEDNLKFYKLGRISKQIEGRRKDIITNVAKFTMESFAQGGKYITDAHKAAIAQMILRTDAASLLGAYSVKDSLRLISDEQFRNAEIARLANQLVVVPNFGHHFIRSAKDLGYYKATGRVTSANLMFSAHNIANLYGTPYAGRITAALASKVTPTIDVLTTLYAMSYVDSKHAPFIKEVMEHEGARTDGNGVEMILKLHQSLQKESKDRLFVAGEPLFMKGYVPEVYNPYVELRAATEDEGANLVKQGYKKGVELRKDQADPHTEVNYLYTLRDGGLQSHVTGTLSYTGRKAKGSRIISGSTNLNSAVGQHNNMIMTTIANNKLAEIRNSFRPNPGYDPRKVGDSKMAPVLNAQGEVVNYRYMMAESTKDTLLERNNSFDELLGILAGNIYDKEMTVKQNAIVIQALKDQFDAEYKDRHTSYRRIGKDSTDPEMREMWRLLPEATKQSIREIWGSNNMMVRLDLIDMNFGYRKLSISDTFTKDAAERDSVERVLYEIGNFLFKEKARLRFKQFEDIWQALVREAKDTMVVKSGVTLMGNIRSNVTELLWFGVPVADILKHHWVAMKGVMAYRKDSTKLERVNLQLSTGYLPTGTVQELQRQKVILENRMARNPVAELIDAGLMPTIVEDTEADDDRYSFKGRFTRKVDEFVSHLNPHVVNTAKTLILAHDTPIYKALSYGTQVSDFVARYTLYKYLTERKENQMTKDEATQMVSDAFINYDVPSHRLLQYANDMGFVYFSKYYLRIQKVIAHLYRDQPGRAMMMLVAGHYFQSMPTLMDASAVHHIGNPFSTGALKYVTTLDEMATVKALMTPFK